jgi:hypothetical protein
LLTFRINVSMELWVMSVFPLVVSGLLSRLRRWIMPSLLPSPSGENDPEQRASSETTRASKAAFLSSSAAFFVSSPSSLRPNSDRRSPTRATNSPLLRGASAAPPRGSSSTSRIAASKAVNGLSISGLTILCELVGTLGPTTR